MQPVFLVDDSPTMLASMAAVLGRAGLAVEKAASGEEALRTTAGEAASAHHHHGPSYAGA